MILSGSESRDIQTLQDGGPVPADQAVWNISGSEVFDIMRGKVTMSNLDVLDMAAAGLGRVTGALAGGVVWLSGGIVATGIVAAAVTCFSLMALLIGFRQWQDGNA